MPDTVRWAGLSPRTGVLAVTKGTSKRVWPTLQRPLALGGWVVKSMSSGSRWTWAQISVLPLGRDSRYFIFLIFKLLIVVEYTWHQICYFNHYTASLVVQMVKNLPVMQEMQVRFLGWEDPLEKGVVPHSRILAWRIPWTEEPDRLQFMALQRAGHDWATKTTWSVQFSSVKHISTVEQPVSRNFSSCKTESLDPLNILSSPSPWQLPSAFCFHECDYFRCVI